MKITKINVENVLGIRKINVNIDHAITIFAGKNGAGKSSIQEAVRMALVGETARVSLKKDYDKLILIGKKSGVAEVEVALDDGGTALAYMTLPDGKRPPATAYVPPTALPYVLDAQSFSALDANARRAFLCGLMGMAVGGDAVKTALLARGCNAGMVDAIMPVLRSGFDAAHAEARERAKEQKTVWRTITGETYGAQKAESWYAEKPDVSADTLADLQKQLAETDAALSAAEQRIGALRADKARADDAAQQREDLQKKADMLPRISEKMERDEESLKEYQQKIEHARQQRGKNKIGLIHEIAYELNEIVYEIALPRVDMTDRMQAEKIESAQAILEAYTAEYGMIKKPKQTPADQETEIDALEDSIRILQRAIQNGQRDMVIASAAAEAITKISEASGKAPTASAIADAQQAITVGFDVRKKITAQIAIRADEKRQAEQADARTAKALAAHKDVVGWTEIAVALAPDGIPGEQLARAVDPINDRLAESAAAADWISARLGVDMSIRAGYPGQPTIDYALLSESEKWRVDAMIAEAISHFAKIKMLVLDRFDVLDLNGRQDLLSWIDDLVTKKEIDTALIFGTLKERPAALPDAITAHWIVDGAIQVDCEQS